jgi:hypothetical protein
MEYRVNLTKKELLTAGKKAQKMKEEARSQFDEDDCKDESHSFQQWATMNVSANLWPLEPVAN